MKIFLAMDVNCLTQEKISHDRLGGTERFFILWDKHLKSKGHKIERFPLSPKGEYDLCIHSNVFNPTVDAKKHILWCGSWHSQGYSNVDIVIFNSQYMKEKEGISDGVVIPAPFDKDLLKYKNGMFVPRRIVTTSNPNRFVKHAIEICNILDDKTWYDWQITGGNRLYRDSWNDNTSLFNGHKNLFHNWAVDRIDLVRILTSAHVWAYPNFSNEHETLCVAALEAAALDIPVFLPNRRPFTDTLPEAYFSDSPKEMATQIFSIFQSGPERISYNVSQYTEATVFSQLDEVINETQHR